MWATIYKSVILLAIFLFLETAFAQRQQWTATDIYKDCETGGSGGVKKICFGESTACIAAKNCTYIVTATANDTHFAAETQTKCDGRADYGAFFGVGVTALSKKNPENSPKYTCTPKFEDFKFVILTTSDEECTSRGEVQKKWGFLPRGILPECKESPEITDLQDFLTHNMMVQSGVIPTQLIAEKKWEASDNGRFYKNANPAENSGFISGTGSLIIVAISAILSTRFL